jgi:hypothetical protein
MVRGKIVAVNGSNVDGVINCYGPELRMDAIVKNYEVLPPVQQAPHRLVKPIGVPDTRSNEKRDRNANGRW